MSIYSQKNYRKIYEQHYGPIGVDENGRSLEIHHIDGNHNNNNITNLKLVTIEEHYNIHFNQGDYGACWMMLTQRMSVPYDKMLSLAKLNAQKRLKDGTHPFLGGEMQKQKALEQIAAGTHHLLGPLHNLRRMQNKTHPSFIKVSCIFCKKTSSLNTFTQWHGDKCKHKS